VNQRGPATGKWFVSNFESHPKDLSQQAQITLQKPIPKRAEPASTTTASATGSLTSKTNVGGYVNPFSSVTNLSPERVDMGVDYNGSGPIKAIGNARVFLAIPSGSGWTSPMNTQAFVGYTLLDGIYAGKHIYVAEDITLQVKTGDKVTAGQTIATFLNSSTGIETGWATGSSAGALASSLNQQAPGDPGAWTSAAGASFNRLLIALGAKSGVIQGAPHGTMPAGYP
jgi:murein DD-endopeptidase MepM/ murein hydrolase activator NlpD